MSFMGFPLGGGPRFETGYWGYHIQSPRRSLVPTDLRAAEKQLRDLAKGNTPTGLPEEFEPKGLVVRQLRQRWGSMTRGEKLILKLSLIRSSVDAIDYVITHELCHMRFRHHGPEFFQLLDRVMPDWEKRKIKLERLLA